MDDNAIMAEFRSIRERIDETYEAARRGRHDIHERVDECVKRLDTVNGSVGRLDADLTAVKTMQVPHIQTCLLYTSPSPRDRTRSRMPSSA